MKPVLTINNQYAKTTLLASFALLLSGCDTLLPKQNQTAAETYFSHSKQRTEVLTEILVGDRIVATNKRSGNSQLGKQHITLYFDTDKFNLNNEEVEHLQSYIMGFSSTEYPVFLVSGHTDDVDTERYNLALSERRASSVKKLMIEMGVPTTQIATRGIGEARPASGNHSASDGRYNRRVTIFAIPKIYD